MKVYPITGQLRHHRVRCRAARTHAAAAAGRVRRRRSRPGLGRVPGVRSTARVNDHGWHPNSIDAFTHDSYMPHVNFGRLRNLSDFAPRRAPTCGALERERTFLTSTYPSPSFLGVEIRRMGERCVHATNRR